MSYINPHALPKTGLGGMVQNWRYDLIAAFSVAMVALPLSLGIADATGVAPIAGLLSVVIGGLVTTLFRGSHMAINGPAAGLITVVAAALMSFKGDPKALHYVLAAIVIAGGFQVVFGLLRMGKLGDLFPASVIQGIMAAIGVIILFKQLHVAMGHSGAGSMVEVFRSLPQSLTTAYLPAGLIALVSLVVLVAYPKIQSKLLHLVPAPMWVLILAIPLGVLLLTGGQLSEIMKGVVETKYLIPIPQDVLNYSNFPHPDFSMLGDTRFWLAVISITLIASIQTLAMAKAVDKLDPYKRSTNFNRDLIGVGLSTSIAGMLGGLPIITVIVRSTVNIHTHGKTKWANFYHGLIILVMVVALAPVMRIIPRAALAAILIYTGFKLASPRCLKDHGRRAGSSLSSCYLPWPQPCSRTCSGECLWGYVSLYGYTW